MAQDYYKTLGVARQATPDEIQKAYRDLARKFHPDLNPNDASAKKKFQEVQAAFDVLNDPQKRENYDQFGPAFESMGRGGPGPGAGGAWPGGGNVRVEDIDLGEIFGQTGAAGGGFADFFRGFGRGRTTRPRGPEPQRGADLRHELTIPFCTSITGGEVQVTVLRKNGKKEAITVKIPPGFEDGKKIRLREQGEPGAAGGPPGDILIQVHITAHPYFQRRGTNLDVRVPVTLAEAAMGAKVDLPTPRGTITLSIPPGTTSGKKLRVKGHGIAIPGEPLGDLFAEIEIAIPPDLDAEDWIVIKKLDSKHPHAPRKDLKW